MNDLIKDVCKIGQGHECCRYLIAGSLGFECAKLDYPSLAVTLDARAFGGTMVARGDNCEGKHGLLDSEPVMGLVGLGRLNEETNDVD